MISILYVDDEPDLLEIGRMMIEGLGEFSVDTVASAYGALEKLDAAPYDAVISDYQMPGMDGIELLKRIRNAGNTVPFIIFTGRGREEIVIQALNEGADFYLQKGGDLAPQFTELAHKVRIAVQRRRDQRELVRAQQRTKRVVEEIADTYYSLDKDWRFTTVNPAAEKAPFARPASELLGKVIWDLYPQLIGTAVHRHYLDAMENQSLEHFEAESLLDNRWYEYFMQGHEEGIDLYMRDITGRKRAEEALDKAVRYNRSLIEASIDPLVTIGPDGRITDVNESTEAVTGYSRNDLIGTDFTGYFTEPEKARAGYRKVFSDGEVRDFPLGIRHRDGHVTPVLFNASVYRDESGAVTGVFAAARDITERKAAELKIRENEERLNRSQALGHVASWEYDPATGKIWGSDEGFRIYGMVPSGDNEMPLGAIEACIPEKERVHRALADLIGRNVPYDLEFAINPADGSPQRIITSSALAVKDASGRLLKVIGVIQDITGRKRAEEELNEREIRFRSLIQNSSDMIRILDCGGKIVYESPSAEAILGYPAGANLGKDPMDFVHPGDRDRVKADLREVFDRTNPGTPTEFRIRKADGTYLWADSIATNLLDLPAVRGIVVTTRVIEPRKKADAALRQSEEKFRSLFRSMSEGVVLHELVEDGTGSATDYRILEMNPAAEKILGVPAGRAVGKLSREAWGSGEPPYLEIYKNVVQSGQPAFFETFFPSMNKYFAVSAYSPEKNRFATVFSDITDRKKAERNLEDVRGLLESAMDMARMARWEYDVKSGTFVFNDRFYALYGTTAEREGGYRMPAAVYAREFVHPEDAHLVEKEIRKVLSTHDPLFTTEVEHRIIRRDGEIRTIVVRYGVILDADGNVVMTHGANQDITDRKMAEDAYRIAEEKYSKVFHSAPDAITLSELDTGRFIEANDAAETIFGYPRSELIGRSALELGIWLSPEDREAFIAQVRNYGRVGDYETRERRKSGQLFTALLNSETITIGGTRYLLAVTRDYTPMKELVDSLRQSEQRYLNIIEDQTEFVCRFLPDGTHVFVNEAYARYFGKSREEITGKIFRPDIPPEDREKVRQFFASLTPEHPVGFIEHRIVMPAGDVRWQHWSDRAIFDDRRNLVEYQSVGRDVTDRKEAEDALRNSATMYRTVFENTGTATVVIEADTTISLANSGFVRLSGYRKEEIEGKKSWTGFVVPEERDRMLAQHHLRRRDHDKALTHYEFRFMTKSGEIRDIDLTIDLIPGTKKSVASLLDITERKKDGQALRESEEKYRTLIDQVNDGIYIYQGDHFVFANNKASEITGYTQEELLAMPFLDIIHPDDREWIREIAEKRMEGEPAEIHYEPRIIRRDGEVRYLEVTVSEIRYKGNHAGIGTVRDITERRKTEEALSHANRQLKILAGVTRHDILNKAMVLLGYIDAARGKTTDPVIQQYLDSLVSAAQDIRDQIEFTRIYQDLGGQKPRWQELRQLVTCQKFPGSISLSVAEKPVWIFADPMVEKVFFNLLDNSIRHGGHVTSVRVSFQESGNGLAIVWQDDGVGIPREEKTRIFERGYGKNTGLGMFLVREILGITGMTITENGVPGRGSRFEIAVPNGGYRFRDPGDITTRPVP